MYWTEFWDEYLRFFTNFVKLDKIETPDLQRPNARMIQTQLVIAFSLGFLNLTLFCILRRHYPKFYSSRLLRRKGLPTIDLNSFFNWLKVVIKDIDERKVLEHAGLDAFVFLSFFKMAIKILAACSFFGFFVISPIRYHYTGGYDQDDGRGFSMTEPLTPPQPEEFKSYLWMYMVFTYIFTITTLWFLYQQTNHVLSIRQKYLGKQNSITDRTIILYGIPANLRFADKLANHIELLNIGKVSSVVICKEWNILQSLFRKRQAILLNLEKEWSKYLKPLNISSKSFVFQNNENGMFALTSNHPAETYEEENSEAIIRDDYSAVISNIVNNTAYGSLDGIVDEESDLLLSSGNPNYSGDCTASINDEHLEVDTGEINLESDQLKLKRPKISSGLFSRNIDSINYYSKQLNEMDNEIKRARSQVYPSTSISFITMESVASAQMVSQAVLDPRANFLTSKLAPAPHDLIWENVCLSRRERAIKTYSITLLIAIISIILIFPVSYLAALLNTKTISKFLPKLGKFLKTHKDIENFVTGLLPTYIFTLFNVTLPFLFVALSARQGFISHGERELSSVSKNFIYLFVNMFLVFTLAGTASNYWGFLSDTTQIAKQLATSLKDLSLFYVDLIIFQGIGMFPFKLLLFGSITRFFFNYSKSNTARELKTLYKPPVFNFGLSLPQPILILIITITYSVMSTKILISGLIYFIVGYYVYKYQLMYAMVHPPHSTGKVWPLVFRRIILGLLIFQITMAGLLALENAFVLSICLLPLPIITCGLLYDFQKHYSPLCYFIALRSIKSDTQSSEFYDDPSDRISGDANENSALLGKSVRQASKGSSVLTNALECCASYFGTEFIATINPNLFSNLTSSQNDTSGRVLHEQTIDEIREKNLNYEYPYLHQALDGPWIAVDGNDAVMINDGITTHKRLEFFEWE